MDKLKEMNNNWNDLDGWSSDEIAMLRELEKEMKEMGCLEFFKKYYSKEKILIKIREKITQREVK